MASKPIPLGLAGDGAGLQDTRSELLRGATLHWMHWVVVGLSLLLTFAAWKVSSRYEEEKVEARFAREADQVIELVTERMRKYEDVLWSGAGLIAAHGGDVDHVEWLEFSRTLRIEEKYPGINGIGVVKRVERDALPAFLAAERQLRPGFGVHPEHAAPEHLPIVYIEPVAINRQAVGLDLAHERNRYTAAKRACDTGQARITGPIVLVQDSERTPGFLFCVPYYRGSAWTIEQRRESFSGLVYAPFVVQKLMRGVLDKDSRHVGLRISDEESVLYDELQPDDSDYDPSPQFQRQVDVELYGRCWKFDIHSSRSFRAASAGSQPATILVAGIVLDSLLLIMFLLLSRANRRAVAYADAASQGLLVEKQRLEETASALERSNADLADFAYIASHDLKEPLRGIGNQATFLLEDHGDDLKDDARGRVDRMITLAGRLERLIDGLLAFSRVGRAELAQGPVDLQVVLETVLDGLRETIEAREAQVEVSRPLPTVWGDAVRLGEVFHNLLTNAIKYSDGRPQVEVGWTEGSCGQATLFHVRDHGIGISPRHQEAVFQIFKRLHGRDARGGGEGVGLAMVKGIIERHGGRVWVESKAGAGSTFRFCLSSSAGEEGRKSCAA